MLGDAADGERMGVGRIGAGAEEDRRGGAGLWVAAGSVDPGDAAMTCSTMPEIDGAPDGGLLTADDALIRDDRVTTASDRSRLTATGALQMEARR